MNFNLLSHNIKYLRKSKGFTYRDIGSRLNVAHSTIAQWETGKRKPKIDILMRFCAIFGVTIEDLCTKDM